LRRMLLAMFAVECTCGALIWWEIRVFRSARVAGDVLGQSQARATIEALFWIVLGSIAAAIIFDHLWRRRSTIGGKVTQ
jgi:hypothetical protein